MEKVELFLMRRKKGITLKQVSEYVNCSIAMLSLFENDKCNMDINKQQKYKEYIQNY